MVYHALFKPADEIDLRKAGSDLAVCGRDHLDHTASARATHGIPEAVVAVEPIEREHFIKKGSRLLVAVTQVIDMLDNTEELCQSSDLFRYLVAPLLEG